MKKKIKSYNELEKMRKNMAFPEDFDPKKELQEALDEKYGCID